MAPEDGVRDCCLWNVQLGTGNFRCSIQSCRPVLCWILYGRSGSCILWSLCPGSTTDSRPDFIRIAFLVPTSQHPPSCCATLRDTTQSNLGIQGKHCAG